MQFEAAVPTVKDRIVQQAVRLVIEPIFESGFCDGSYGFRPERGSKDALREVDRLLKEGYTHVVDADLQSYLDVASYYTFSFFERVEEVRSNCRYLNSYAFCPSAIDVNGLKLAALYTLQDGLPRDAE